jgi:hypothetical protein
MNHRTLVTAGGLALTVLATACLSTTDNTALHPFSFIDVRELPASNTTGLGAYASAIFTKDRVSGVVPSSALSENCNLAAPITTSDGGDPSSSTNLEPGSVSMSLHGTTDNTTRTVPLSPTTVSSGLMHYTNSSSPALSAGTDSIAFSVAGQAGGFPPFTIRTLSVAPFVAQPVDDSVVGQGIRVQWTGPAVSTTSRMQISLQYTSATGSQPDMEIRCIAIDDGDFTIPRQYLGEWQDAGVDANTKPRQVVMSRFNTIGANVADGIAAVVVRIDTTMIKH